MLNKLKITLLLVVLLLCDLGYSQEYKSQELNVTVSVIAPEVESTDRTIYNDMQTNITKFLNENKWTRLKMYENERIEANILITIRKRVGSEKFEARIQVISSRPIYKTSYNSPMLNFLDETFNFEYIELQPLEYVKGTFTSNLTSVLAFYAYMIIGLDAESFEEKGGTEYFREAQTIVNSAQGKGYGGWDAFNTKKNNRYFLVNQYLESDFLALRKSIYKYHRLGLDKMHKEQENNRQTILASLRDLKEVHRNEPNSFTLKTYLNSKKDEIIKLFSEATHSEKQSVIKLIEEIDVANSSRFREKLK